MTCKKLGETCYRTINANTFKKMAELRKQHLSEWYLTKDNL